MGTHCPVSHASPGPTEVGASAGGQGAARCGRRVGSGRRGERGGGGPGRAVGLVRSLALALPLGSLTARASARLLGRRGPPAEWGRVGESRASCTGRGQPMRPGPRPGGSESGLARPGRRGRFRGCRQAGVGPAGQQDPAEGRAHGRATGARAGGQTRRHPESAKGKSHSGPRHSRPRRRGGERKPLGDRRGAVSWGVRRTPGPLSRGVLGAWGGRPVLVSRPRPRDRELEPVMPRQRAVFTGRTSVSAHGHRRFPRGVATRGLCSASSTSPRGGAPLFLSPLLVPSTPAVSCWALWFFKLNLSFRKSGESSRPPVPPCVCWGDVGQAAPRAQLGSRPSPAHSCGSVGTGGGDMGPPHGTRAHPAHPAPSPDIRPGQVCGRGATARARPGPGGARGRPCP